MSKFQNQNANLTALALASEINAKRNVFGTFSEIGAGLETSRTFFQVPNTSWTVAKSMSAYAKEISDELYMEDYDEAKRKAAVYTSRFRLLRMLDREYNLLKERFAKESFAATRRAESAGAAKDDFPAFFVFANSVSVRNYWGREFDKCHGWVGARVQCRDNPQQKLQHDSARTAPYLDLLAHVVMLEDEREDQMDTLGIFGVFLLYEAIRIASGNPLATRKKCGAKDFVKGLYHNLDLHKFRIDVIEIVPSDNFKPRKRFSQVNGMRLGYWMVQQSLTHSVLLSKSVEPERSDVREAIIPEVKARNEMRFMFPGNDQHVPVRFLSRSDVLVHHLPIVSGKVPTFDQSAAREKISDSWGLDEKKEGGRKEPIHLFVSFLSDYPDESEEAFVTVANGFLKWMRAEYNKSKVIRRTGLLFCRYRDPAWLIEHICRFTYDEGRVHLALSSEEFAALLSCEDFIANDSRFPEAKKEMRARLKVRGTQVWSDSPHDCLLRIARRTFDEKGRPSCAIRVRGAYAGKLPAKVDAGALALVEYMERTEKITCYDPQ